MVAAALELFQQQDFDQTFGGALGHGQARMWQTQAPGDRGTYAIGIGVLALDLAGPQRILQQQVGAGPGLRGGVEQAYCPGQLSLRATGSTQSGRKPGRVPSKTGPVQVLPYPPT